MPSYLRVVMLLTVASILQTQSIPATAEEPDPRYWRLDDILVQFDSWQTAYPDIFHQTTLGPSGEGEPIPLVRISDNAAVSEPEPRLFFHAAQHANECNGTGAIMRTIETLLTGYGVDPQLTARVDGLELWYLPVVNVDGHRYVFSGAPSWADWRKTLRDNDDDDEVDFPDDGVDTNRNWDWNWNECSDSQPWSQKYKGPWPWSEAEVRALRDFIQAERPVIVVDYHSPVTIAWSNFIFWPWLSTHGGGFSPDEPVARDIAEQWADDTRTETGAHYSTLYAYDTLPKEQCWVYGQTGILTFLMEIGDHCWWNGATVDTIATRVARGSQYLLERALTGPGIAGRVVDAFTDQPLVAEVQLDEMHGDGVGPRLTEARFGQYHRLTETGTYTVRVSRRDYENQVRTVQVDAGAWTVADFALVPTTTSVGGDGFNDSAGDDTAEPAGATNWFSAGNPLRAGSRVQILLPADLPDGRAELLTLAGRRITVLGDRIPAGGRHELSLPGNVPAGVYLVRVSSGRMQQVQRITIVH